MNAEESKTENRRKILHLSHVFWVAGFFLFEWLSSEKYAFAFALFSIVILMIAEWARLNFGFTPGYAFAVRKSEKNKVAATLSMFVASTLVLAVFPRSIALAAILMTTFGDVAASVFGRKYGKTRIMGKTLEGALAGFIANLAVSLIVFLLLFNNADILLRIGLIIIMPVVASLVELLTNKMEDNLTVPVIASIAGYILWVIWFI